MRVPLPLRRRARAAALLLASGAALLDACADKSPTGPGATGDPATPGSPSGAVVPDAVVGAWKSGTISSLSFWDSHTGDYVGTAGGLSIFFKFESDGHYTMQLYVLTRAYSCVTQSWTELKGTVAFDGGTFVTHPTEGRYQGSDTCVAANNFTRAATSSELAQEVRTHWWSFEPNPNDGKTYLMIGRDSDNRSFFSRDQ